MRQIAIIKGSFSKKKLESILGEPSWKWKEEKVEGDPECGLLSGILLSAGWGDTQSCCRIWIHKDGICIAPGLNVPSDIRYAKRVAKKIAEETEKEIQYVG